MGPNCLGLMRPPIGLDATFARGGALPGSLALVSQSGAVCAAMLDWAKPSAVGFSSVISMGGSSDLDFGEVIDYLAADGQTEHILLYIEGVRDGRRLVGSLRAAARMKPVIVMREYEVACAMGSRSRPPRFGGRRSAVPGRPVVRYGGRGPGIPRCGRPLAVFATARFGGGGAPRSGDY
jgi:succinyl-CoA synthetase alpha subunit